MKRFEKKNKCIHVLKMFEKLVKKMYIMYIKNAFFWHSLCT